jgi:conjugative relaxase-like TrwC/TraI family protein
VKSMNTISSGDQEKEEYYTEDESLRDEQEEYYGKAETKSSSKKMTQAVWHGKGAYALGLEGHIDRSDFKQVFYGYKPGTEERIRCDRPVKANKERLGHDFTLSAPKSFSMALHLGGDERLFDAHMEAAKETIDLVESLYAQARVQVAGNRNVVNTGNLVVALIPHHTSREKDMQLHTHCVIMNGTQCADGQWRALWHESIRDAEWLGSYYRSLLAQKVQKLGYEIHEKELDRGFSFELKGYTPEQIEAFSKRSRDIVKSLEERGLEVNAENRDAAVLTTRKRKTADETLEEFQYRLINEATQYGIENPQWVQGGVKPLTHGRAKKELESAIRHLCERSVSFSLGDVYTYVFEHIQSFGVEAVNEAIAQHKELIPAEDPRRLTTVSALELENKIVTEWEKGKGKAKSILNELKALEALRGTGLNLGQAKAIAGALGTTDNHVIMYGLSGVGKTTALREYKQLIDGSGLGIKIKGFSPRIKAAKVLSESLGIETNTVEHLVLAKTDLSPNQLWVIDESGMIGNRQMEKILMKAQLAGARILLVGDPKQNPAIEAGSPMLSLINYGQTTFSIKEIVRQQNAIQKRAVELIANGQGRDALSLLVEHGYVREISDTQQRCQTIADEWLALNQKGRNNALVLTGTNAERLSIVNTVRNGLRAEGTLQEDHLFTQLVSRNLSHEKKRRIENYRIGDYLKLSRDFKTCSLEKDILYQVVSIKDKQLLVKTQGGRLYLFDPAKFKDKEVFSGQEIAIAVGDRLRCRITDKKENLVNGHEFEVAAINGTTITLKDEKGRERKLDGLKPLGLDYAYVSTVYNAQGITAKRTFLSATSDLTSAQEPFYVGISRQEDEIIIFAEDLAELRDWVGRSVTQENAVDVIGEDHERNNTPRTNVGEPTEDDHSVERTDGAVSGGEQSNAIENGSDIERSSNRSTARTPDVPKRVSRDSGESKTFRISGSHPATSGRTERTERADQQFGVHSRGYEHSNESGPVRDQRADESLIQQRVDEIRQQVSQNINRISERSLIEAQVVSHEPASVRQLGQMQATMDHICELVESELLVQSLAENGSLEAIRSLTNAINALPERRPRASYEGMEAIADSLSDLSIDEISFTQYLYNIDNRLINAIAQQQFEAAINECAGQIRDVHRELKHLAARAEMGVIAEVITDLHNEECLNQLQVLESIQQLTQKVERITQNSPQKQYQNLEELCAALTTVQEEEFLYGALQEIQETVGALQQSIESATRRTKMNAVADALNEWRAEQELTEAVAQLSQDHQPGDLERLTQATQQVKRLEQLRPETELLVNLVQEWQVEQNLCEAFQSLIESASVSQKYHYAGMQEFTNELYQLHEEQQLSEALLEIEQNEHVGQFRPDLERIAALLQEWQAEQNLSEALQQVNLSPQQHRYQGLRAVVEGLSQLHDDQLLSEESIAEAINDLRKTVASLAAPKYQGMKELASAINDRHAAESIHEHLSLFHEATTQLQENLQHNPGLEKLAETVRSLRNNPAIAEATNEHLQQISQRLREFGLSTTPKPEKLEPFWVPEYREGDRPGHIDEKHWQEMTESAIHPKLIAANVRSIEGPTVLQYLLEEKLDTLGGESGQYATEDVKKLFKRYKPLAGGGWWGSAGIDAVSLEHLQPSDKPVLSNWGAFKGDNPRIDYQKSQSKGKTQYIKYEHPLGVERHLYLPVVPEKLTDRSLSKHGIERTDQEQDSSYWQMVKDHPEIPINLGEGFKKTLASISQGDVQIGGSGVNAFYRSRDAQGRKLPERVLNEQLAVFAVPGRLFRFTFDQDAKPSTVRNVRRDMVRTIELLESRGCICKVVYWEGDKGLDDLIAHQGPRTYAKAIATAQCAEREKRIHYRTEYKTIAHQVRKTNSGITQENLDCEVFLRAIAKGDLNDGERFMSQSDHASTLKSPVEVQTYVEHIKAIAPQYFQQQRELTKAQVAMRRQQQQDRSEYETIAQRVRKDPSNVNVIDQIIDLQVYLIAEAERGAGHGDTLIAQSDHVLNRPYPIDVQQYIDQIREHVSLHQQTLQDQSEYETLATEARAELPTEATPLEVDALVYFELRDQGRLEDSERILRFSPHLRSIESLDSAKQYLQKVRLASQHYEQDTVRRDRLIQRIKVGNDLVNLKVVEQLGLDVMAIMSNGQPYTNDKLFNFEKNRSGAIRISLKDGTTVYENGKVNPDVERAILDRLEFTLPKAMENIKRDIAQQVDQQKGMHRDRDIDLEQ